VSPHTRYIPVLAMPKKKQLGQTLSIFAGVIMIGAKMKKMVF
jgi:hypothetical protein